MCCSITKVQISWGSVCQYLKFSILLLRRDFILGIICLFSRQKKDLYHVCCSIKQNKVLNTSNRFNSDHKNTCWLYRLPVYSGPSYPHVPCLQIIPSSDGKCLEKNDNSRRLQQAQLEFVAHWQLFT